MPAPSRPESATMSATATQQQQPLGAKSGMGRRGLRVMRPKTSATKEMPRDAPAPARVTAWFTSTVYDLSLSANHLVPIMERNNAAAPAAPVMAGEWAANMPPAAAMAAEPQANPPAADMPGHRAAMMMLMDGRMAAGRAAKGNDVNKNDMGRTQYKHGAPPRAPPPAYKQQPMSRAQRTQQRSRTARSAMAASRS